VSAPDFLAIGHVTLDRFGTAIRPGGAALYAAVAAHRSGVPAGILTSLGPDFPLDLVPPQIEVVSVPSPHTTIFGHAVDPVGARTLGCGPVASPIRPADVPEDWRGAPLVLLAPVINELDPLLAAAFPEATVAAAAQGWLRGLMADGRVVPTRWDSAGQVLPRIQTLFLSGEDIRAAAGEALEWYQQIPVGVLTAGRLGALLFVNGERYEVPPYPVQEVDPTGAGDVFAAAFLLHYARQGDPWDAAAAGACAAALSVQGPGASAIPDARRLETALEAYRRTLGRAP
jgi:sugar/nucleoside kinase (ribokinase family)